MNKDKNLHTYSISDFYSDYSKERKVWNNSLTRTQYIAILKDFLYEVSKLIIVEKYWFNMFYRLGRIRIKKISTPSNKAKIDWKKSKELGKQVRYRNIHTDGKSFRWHWKKPPISVTNQSYYSFSATRDELRKEIGTRGLAKHIIDCSKDPYKKDYNCLP